MKDEKCRVLYIEENLEDQVAFEDFFRSGSFPFEFQFSNSVYAAKKILNLDHFDVILTGYDFSNKPEVDIFELIPDVPVILLSRNGSEIHAVKAFKKGVYDYIIKDKAYNYIKKIPSVILSSMHQKEVEKKQVIDKNILENEIQERTQELANAYYELVMKFNESKANEEKYKKYEFIVNSFKEFMMLISTDYIYEAVNTYFKYVVGLEEEVIGKKVNEIWGHIQFEEKMKSHLQKCFKGKEVHYQEWLAFPEKENKFYEIAIYPYYNPAKKVSHVVMVLKDITERKQMEQQLINSERLAAIGELSAGVAHEIKNPITIIKSTAQFCHANYNELSEEKIKKIMDIFMEASDRINKTVNDLIEFSKSKQDNMYPQNILEIINKVCLFVQDKSHAKKIKIKKNISTKSAIIILDRDQIFGAILNLILNAFEAIQKDGEITISAHSIKKEFELIIKDNGIGISKENLKKVFNPFFTTKKNGTGLGLSLVTRIINFHNGSIKLVSEEGKGTEAILRFPIHK